jgi:hypothetical protein
MAGPTDLAATLVAGLPDIGVYRFEFHALEPLTLPDYPGSTWRGLVGHGLRKTVCVTRQPECDGCLLLGSCAYPALFEAPPPQPGMRAETPLPYCLAVDFTHRKHLAEGDALDLAVHLFGSANGFLPYLIHSLRMAAERGIGATQGRARLTSVWQRPGPDAAWQPIYDGAGVASPLPPFPASAIPTPGLPERVQLELLTPLRIKRQGHFVGRREFGAEECARHLLWRLEALARHFGAAFDPDLWRQAHDLARPLTLTAATLHWHEWTRRSARQDTRMQMGGLLGTVTLEGPGLELLWPLLQVGQWTLLGKAPTMGLGRYQVQPAASLPDQTGIQERATVAAVGGPG